MAEEKKPIVIEETVNSVEEAKEVNFLNPFEPGVTYTEFQKALGKKTVADYCKGKLTDDKIEWLENELLILKTK